MPSFKADSLKLYCHPALEGQSSQASSVTFGPADQTHPDRLQCLQGAETLSGQEKGRQAVLYISDTSPAGGRMCPLLARLSLPAKPSVDGAHLAAVGASTGE